MNCILRALEYLGKHLSGRAGSQKGLRDHLRTAAGRTCVGKLRRVAHRHTGPASQARAIRAGDGRQDQFLAIQVAIMKADDGADAQQRLQGRAAAAGLEHVC